ncbi:hypothetical protein BDZ91DRAFT_31636 [Kalaharituber pfeilii]|nr:hypothetical protein BDZ91DRAFT_31636 [Kalaharituber pfeilii]
MSPQNLTICTRTGDICQSEFRRSTSIETPQRSPPPKTPLPWTWKCHKCQRNYRFRATHRCLSCSHMFCGRCASELDYAGWREYDAYWSKYGRNANRQRCRWVYEEEDNAGITNSDEEVEQTSDSEGDELFYALELTEDNGSRLQVDEVEVWREGHERHIILRPYLEEEENTILSQELYDKYSMDLRSSKFHPE